MASSQFSGVEHKDDRHSFCLMKEMREGAEVGGVGAVGGWCCRVEGCEVRSGCSDSFPFLPRVPCPLHSSVSYIAFPPVPSSLRMRELVSVRLCACECMWCVCVCMRFVCVWCVCM